LTDRPVILIGCGRLGSSLVEGWLKTGGLDLRTLIIVTPSSKPIAEAARDKGALINPGDDVLARADRVILGVKPAMWRQVAADMDARLAPDALIISMMAGVRASALSDGFKPRPVARVMPTTSMAVGEGVASIWAENDADLDKVRGLFAPVAKVVGLADDGLMDAATAVSGSGQAYFFAFVDALTKAGVEQGLSPAQAEALASGTLVSAAAAMKQDGARAEDLIARVASPGGTTRAALDVFAQDGSLERLVSDAAAAAVARAAELSGS
jgi:pyrroline-5-carboxylate reductase